MNYAGSIHCPYCGAEVVIGATMHRRPAGSSAAGWALVCHVRDRQAAGVLDHGKGAPGPANWRDGKLPPGEPPPALGI